MVVNSLFLSYSWIVNIKELAKKLGLSITTVSRALGGYSDVSEVTRKRVKDFAKKHNYKPNPYASNLASSKSMERMVAPEVYFTLFV